MADNKCCPYSFYVPVKDKALNDFIEAQSNLSMTIRLLLKAFIGNYDKEYPDVTMMDLRELMNSMKIDPEVITEMMMENKKVKTIKKPEAKQDAIIDMSKIITDDEIKSDIIKSEVKSDVTDDETDNNFDIEESDNDSQYEYGEDSDDNDEASDNDEVSDNEQIDESEEDITPVVTVEPEKPHKLINSSRDEYNKKQVAEVADMDEILNLMGE